jgi:hypothetical protein
VDARGREIIEAPPHNLRIFQQSLLGQCKPVRKIVQRDDGPSNRGGPPIPPASPPPLRSRLTYFNVASSSAAPDNPQTFKPRLRQLAMYSVDAPSDNEKLEGVR